MQNIICENCAKQDKSVIRISEATLYAIKYIIIEIVIASAFFCLTLLVIAILTFMVEMLFGGISFMNFKRMRKVNVSNSLVLDEIYENEFNHIEIDFHIEAA